MRRGVGAVLIGAPRASVAPLRARWQHRQVGEIAVRPSVPPADRVDGGWLQPLACGYTAATQRPLRSRRRQLRLQQRSVASAAADSPASGSDTPRAEPEVARQEPSTAQLGLTGTVHSPFPAQHLLQTLRIGRLDVEDLRAAFDRYDTDGNGVLCINEVRELVSEVGGGRLSPEELNVTVTRFMKEFDTDGDQLVQREEFDRGIKRLAKELDPRAHYLAACILVAFSGFSVTFPLGPEIIKTFTLTNMEFGSFGAIFTLSRMLGNIPSSVLADIAGRRAVLCAGLTLVAVGVGGTASSSGYVDLALLRVATGMGVAATFTSAGMYLTDISHSLNSARTRAPMMMAMAAGTMLGPPIGGFLLEWGGLRHTCLVVSVSIVSTAAAAAVLLPETLEKKGTGPRRSLKEGIGATLAEWRPLLRDGEMRKVLCLGSVWNMSFWGVQAIFPLFFVQLDLSTVTVGYIFMMNAAVNFVCAPVVAVLADRCGKLAIVVPGALVFGVGVIAIPHATTMTELVGLMVVLQLGGSMAGTVMAHAIDIAPRQSRAQVQGLYNTVGDAGGMVGSTVGACVAELASLAAAFHFEGFALIVTFAAYAAVAWIM
eukprot:TRINITY_DN43237_c0_g1_i1.p1 TRINITY_DN43237_c0_g1~~TRINITY_DN43237_c0_g1_i1.p1  ORF type:complete len:616 (+),score=176.75 TRINITY_DN43237_c0_g1_i1:55-1848(+)